MRSRRIAAGAACIALVTLTGLAGNVGSAGAHSAAKGSYVLGTMDDLSGSGASDGASLLSGLQAGIAGINKRGGINGHQIKLIVRDDKSDPATSISDIRELAAKNVSAIYGIQGAATTAVAPLTASLKVPVLANSLPTNLLNPVQPYMYDANVAFSLQARAEVDVLKQLTQTGGLPKNPRVADLYIGTPSGTDFDKAVRAEASKFGWNLVESESFQPTATDYSPQVIKVLAAKPDAVVLLASSSFFTGVVTAFNSTGADKNILLVTHSSTSQPAYMKSVKWKRWIALSTLKPPGASKLVVIRNMESDAARVHADPKVGDFEIGYAMTLIVTDALKRCGYPCPAAKMTAALNKTNTNIGGLSPYSYVYTSKSHSGGRGGQFVRWDAARNAEVAVGKPIYWGTGN